MNRMAQMRMREHSTRVRVLLPIVRALQADAKNRRRGKELVLHHQAMALMEAAQTVLNLGGLYSMKREVLDNG